MDRKKIFDNYLTNHYSNCEKINFNKSEEILLLLNKNKALLDYNFGKFFEAKISKKSCILDLGCGYGSFLYFLQSHQYGNVTGVDLSTEEINLCNKFFKSYKFFQADIFDYINNTKDKFDVIYLSHVLEHIKKERVVEFLESVKNILTTNGFFILIVPNSAAYFNSAANRYGDLTHEVGFTDKSLKQVLMTAGFSSIEIENYFGVGNFWLNIARKATFFLFGIFIQILGYEKQEIYTPSILIIAKN